MMRAVKLNNKGILLFLLLCSILLQTACSGNTENTESTEESRTVQETEAPQETAYTPADLPVVDYEGAEFCILANDRTDDYASVEFAALEMLGTGVNDAVFSRNAEIAEAYNVKMVNLPTTNEADALRTNVTAGETAYDIALIRLDQSGPLALDGLLADFGDLPYVDTKGESWDRNAAEQMTLGGKLFMTLGDMNINDKDMTWCLFFSKNLAAMYSLPDIYDIVRDGKWTFDTFAGLCQDVSVDVNGDGIYDENDQWGHVTVLKRSTIAYMYSMGSEFIRKDPATDLPVTNFEDENMYDAYFRIMEFFWGGNTCHDVETMPYAGYAHQWRKCEAMFGADQILFYGEAMQNAERFRQFDNDFGILPLPSLREGETGMNMVWKESYATVVPLTSIGTTEGTERTGLLLEAIQRASHDTVLPAYYDKALKGKFSRDEESGDMIDIIFANRYYDIAAYYGWGGATEAVMQAGGKNNQELRSTLVALEEKTKADIDAMTEMLGRLEK